MENDALNSKTKSNQDNFALFSIVDELQQILNYANKNLIKKQKEKINQIERIRTLKINLNPKLNYNKDKVRKIKYFIAFKIEYYSIKFG